MSFRFKSALAATQGRRRYQEDTGLVWTDAGAHPASAAPFLAGVPAMAPGELVAVLGDGMGGHVGGATASRLASETFVTAFVPDERRASERLLAALHAGNDALARKVSAQPMFKGMGTTLIGAHFCGSGLAWTSVGDSLLYLWRRGDLARLNEDHSLAPELDKMAAAGRISRADAETDPRRHYLRSALTGEEIEMIDVALKPLELAADDVVIVASDGLATLHEVEIAEAVAANLPEGPEAIAATLIARIDAAHRPQQDNATVIAVVVESAA